MLTRTAASPLDLLEPRTMLSADLTISIVSPASNAAVATGVESVGFVQIANNGSTDVRERFGVSLFVSTDSTLDSSDLLVGSRRRSGASAGESEVEDIEFRLPSLPEGTYTLFAVVDSGDAIAESDEANNVSAGVAIQVGGSGGGGGGSGSSGADLVVTITAPIGGSTLTLGREQRVIISARNLGDAGTAIRSGVSLYASSDRSFDSASDTLLASRLLSTMSPGETELEDLEFILPSGLGEGEFFLIAVIDPAGEIAERVESNNVSAPVAVNFTAGASVGSPADLTVSLSSASFDDSLRRSGMAEVYVTVVNSGGSSSGRMTVSLFASADGTLDPAGDVLLGARLFSSIAAGASETEDIEFLVPAGFSEGEYTVYAVVDSGGVVAESDETNNRSAGIVVDVGTASLDLSGSITSLRFSESIIAGSRSRGSARIEFSNLGDDSFVPGQTASIGAFLRDRKSVV